METNYNYNKKTVAYSFRVTQKFSEDFDKVGTEKGYSNKQDFIESILKRYYKKMPNKGI